MDKKQALGIVGQVCAAHSGTLQDHQAIQEALKVISTLEEPKTAKESTKEEIKKK